MIDGDRLKELRHAMGLTQKQLGERCGYDQPWISELELGTRPRGISVKALVKLAYTLKMHDLSNLLDVQYLTRTKQAVDDITFGCRNLPSGQSEKLERPKNK